MGNREFLMHLTTEGIQADASALIAGALESAEVPATA
jgi:hypothetical protein